MRSHHTSHPGPPISAPSCRLLIFRGGACQGFVPHPHPCQITLAPLRPTVNPESMVHAALSDSSACLTTFLHLSLRLFSSNGFFPLPPGPLFALFAPACLLLLMDGLDTESFMPER
ncbi:hypothetical protein B0H10DRAFT_2101905 [Mycena sp. CBHHK59/15]|nr:hypothetical protein B0H10DRAFT_2101905 [Mycena sp. CBHHK59/15]